MKQKHNVSVENLDIEFSTGTLAGLASGSVTIRSGETTVLSATAASALRPGQDFFPLTVDYREKILSRRKIPWGLFQERRQTNRKRNPNLKTLRSSLKTTIPKRLHE